MKIPYELNLKPAATPDSGTRIKSRIFHNLSYPASACTKKAKGEAIHEGRLVRREVGAIIKGLVDSKSCYL